MGHGRLRNPVRGVKMPRSRPARERRLEPGEEERLLKACAAAGNIWLRPVANVGDRDGHAAGRDFGPSAPPHPRQRCLPAGHQDRPPPFDAPLSSRALGILQDVPAAIGGVAFPITQDSLEYDWRKPAGPRGSVVVAHGGVRCERAAVGAAPPAQGGRPRRAGGLLPAPGRHGPSADARGCSPDASDR